MKFLALAPLQALTNCLVDRIVGDIVFDGRIDAYSCKAAGEDKKFERQLSRQFNSEDAVPAGMSTSMPTAIGISQGIVAGRPRSDSVSSLGTRPRAGSSSGEPSPFGDLADANNRRVFAHLIETLNATFPDFDYTSLPVSAFRRVASAVAPTLSLQATHSVADPAASIVGLIAPALVASPSMRDSSVNATVGNASSTAVSLQSFLPSVVRDVNGQLADLAAEEARLPKLPGELDAVLLQAAAAAGAMGDGKYRDGAIGGGVSRLSAGGSGGYTVAVASTEGDTTAADSRTHLEREHPTLLHLTKAGTSGPKRAQTLLEADGSRAESKSVVAGHRIGRAKRQRSDSSGAGATETEAVMPSTSVVTVPAGSGTREVRPAQGTAGKGRTKRSAASTRIVGAGDINNGGGSSVAAFEATVPSELTQLLQECNGRSFLDALWSIVDASVLLRSCDVYEYVPRWDSDPLLAGALRSFNYFFHNRALKRLIFFYVTARSAMSTFAAVAPGPPVGSPVRRAHRSVDSAAAQAGGRRGQVPLTAYALLPYVDRHRAQNSRRDAASKAALIDGRGALAVVGREVAEGTGGGSSLAASPTTTAGAPSYLDDDSAAIWGVRPAVGHGAASSDGDDNLAATYGRVEFDDDPGADDDGGRSGADVDAFEQDHQRKAASDGANGVGPPRTELARRRSAVRRTYLIASADCGTSDGEEDDEDARSDYSYSEGTGASEED